MNENCKNCRYGLRHGDSPSDGLTCRRFPHHEARSWGDWCGEWKGGYGNRDREDKGPQVDLSNAALNKIADEAEKRMKAAKE